MIIVNKEMLEMMRIIFLCIVTGAWNVGKLLTVIQIRKHNRDNSSAPGKKG